MKILGHVLSRVGISWMSQNTTLTLERFQKTSHLVVKPILVRFRKQNLFCPNTCMLLHYAERTTQGKKNANQGGSLLRNILLTAGNSIKDHYLIHVSKIRTHVSTTTLARVLFRTDFQLPEWFLLKKFPLKSPYVNYCLKAVLFLLNESCFLLKKIY